MTIFEAVKSKTWWISVFERAIKTFFQTLIAVGGVISFTSLSELTNQWLMAVVSSAIAMVLSVFTSICNYEVLLANGDNKDE